MFDGATKTKDRGFGGLYRIRTEGGSFRLDPNATPAQEIDASIVRNPKKPGLKRTAVVVLVQLMGWSAAST